MANSQETGALSRLFEKITGKKTKAKDPTVTSVLNELSEEYTAPDLSDYAKTDEVSEMIDSGKNVVVLQMEIFGDTNYSVPASLNEIRDYLKSGKAVFLMPPNGLSNMARGVFTVTDVEASGSAAGLGMAISTFVSPYSTGTLSVVFLKSTSASDRNPSTWIKTQKGISFN